MKYHNGTAGLRLFTSLTRVVISFLCFSYVSAAHAGYIYYEKRGPDTFVVRGHVDLNDLRWDWNINPGTLSVLVHETGNRYWLRLLASPPCPNYDDAVRVINNALQGGVVVSQRANFADEHPPWTAQIRCPDGRGGSHVASSLSSPPTQPICHVTLPTLVDFGRIPQGFIPPPVRGKIRIECDRGATGEAYFSQLTSGRVRLSPDGWMTPSFNKSGGTRTRFATAGGVYEETVVFELSDPGTDVGVKVGQAVVIVSWS
ncbi:hypothetical protein SM14VA2_48190 (plasmid) [Serratia marcescens]|nr:hypothetical protein SM14VA2_48190 [Serratia marcescens]